MLRMFEACKDAYKYLSEYLIKTCINAFCHWCKGLVKLEKDVESVTVWERVYEP